METERVDTHGGAVDTLLNTVSVTKREALLKDHVALPAGMEPAQDASDWPGARRGEIVAPTDKEEWDRFVVR